MDRTKARLIMERVQQTLAPLGEELGVQFSIKSGSVSGSIVLKLEASEIDAETGVAGSREAEAFRAYAAYHGIPIEALGQEFESRGKRYRLTGYAARRDKFPFTAVRIADGAQFKFPAAVIERAFKKIAA